MTSSNGLVSPGSPAQDMTPEQIQLEITRTRSAITDDLRALSERFNPTQLRESAREVMRDAREEATHLIQDAKQAAFGPLIDAKERTIQRVHALGEQTREAGVLTVDFLTKNRVMMSLLGIASGLLVYALRGRRSLPRLPQLPRAREASYSYEVPLDEPPMQPREPDSSSPFATRRPETARRGLTSSPGAVIAATVLAGVGLGLLLPAAKRLRR